MAHDARLNREKIQSEACLLSVWPLFGQIETAQEGHEVVNPRVASQPHLVVAALKNNRLRKTLGCRTPADAIADDIAAVRSNVAPETGIQEMRPGSMQRDLTPSAGIAVPAR